MPCSAPFALRLVQLRAYALTYVIPLTTIQGSLVVTVVTGLLTFVALFADSLCAWGTHSNAVPTPMPTNTPAATPTVAPTATPIHVPRPVVLPDDEAPHSDPVEWWYYSGTMEDETGAEYGFHFVIFQVTNPEADAPGYMAHSSVLDINAGQREQDVRFGIGAQAQPETGFELGVVDWTLRGDDGTHSFAASTNSYAFDLTVEATKPAALHNEIGYLVGLSGWTYYYSWTRMDLSGTLTVDGQELEVTGRAWMDHQWGDFVVSGYPTGWQWFSVSMENGNELMVAEAREADGQKIVYGTPGRPIRRHNSHRRGGHQPSMCSAVGRVHTPGANTRQVGTSTSRGTAWP